MALLGFGRRETTGLPWPSGARISAPHFNHVHHGGASLFDTGGAVIDARGISGARV